MSPKKFALSWFNMVRIY